MRYLSNDRRSHDTAWELFLVKERHTGTGAREKEQEGVERLCKEEGRGAFERGG